MDFFQQAKLLMVYNNNFITKSKQGLQTNYGFNYGSIKFFSIDPDGDNPILKGICTDQFYSLAARNDGFN